MAWSIRMRARMKFWLRRVADWFPWTPLGLLVAAAAAYALYAFAFGQMDVVLLSLGYGTVGLLALSTTFVLAAALITKLQLRAPEREDALELETQRSLPTAFTLPALRWLPLVQIRWEWERPIGFDVESTVNAGKAHERVTPSDRGTFEGIRRRIIVEDAFGLVRLGLRMNDPAKLQVVPSVGALNQMPVLMSMSGGEDFPHPLGVADGDRVDLRRYGPGDPARFIHWKIYSRTRKLMVRIPERALTRSTRTVAYLVAGESDDASAGAARVALQSKAFGEDWAFAADGGGLTSRLSDALDAIVTSRDHRERGGQGLETFLRDVERSGPASVVVFVPPVPGPWVQQVSAALAARRGRAKIVIGVDGLRATGVRALWARALSRPPGGTKTQLEPLEDLLRQLSSLRIGVLVLDRITGRQLSAKHRAAALKRAA